MTSKISLIDDLDSFDFEKYQDLTLQISRVDKHDIDSEMVGFPQAYSYYYGLLVKAKSKVDVAKLNLEEHRAFFKSVTKANSTGKMTVETLENLVNKDDTTKELNRIVLQADEIYGLVKAICNTLEHKKDMLVQLSANKRQETKLYQ